MITYFTFEPINVNLVRCIITFAFKFFAVEYAIKEVKVYQE
jgi:hypothetical protein